MQSTLEKSESDSYEEWTNNTFDDATEFQVKKFCKAAFEDLGSDSKLDEESDAEFQSRDKKRKTKTPSYKRNVRLTSEKERLTGVGTSNVEAHHYEDIE